MLEANTAPLSQRRKADRKAMADQIEIIAAKFGAEVTRDEDRLTPGEIYMRLKLPGASVQFGFEAAAEGARGWGYLGHWVCEPGRKFRAGFASVQSNYPHHKATTSADTFDVFAALLQSGLRQVSEGRAFA
jgi:hypothetical protein